MLLEDKTLALERTNNNSCLDCLMFISLSNCMEISSCLLGITLEKLFKSSIFNSKPAIFTSGKALGSIFPLTTANLCSYPRGCTVSGSDIGRKSAQHLRNAPR